MSGSIGGETWVECFTCGCREFKKVGKAKFGRVRLSCCKCGRTLTKDPRDIIENNGIATLRLKRDYVDL